jgi:hypothetical protein
MHMTIGQLQDAVGTWSVENFGNNVSKSGLHSEVVLGHVASVLGLMEEVGELLTADTLDKAKDAYADVGIYFSDFCHRSKLDFLTLYGNSLAQPVRLVPGLSPRASLAAEVGRLAHVVLKHHQGIRGMSDPVAYRTALESAAQRLVHVWRSAAILEGVVAKEATFSVWEKIVAKRNWKKDAATGGGEVAEQQKETIQAVCDAVVGREVVRDHGDVKVTEKLGSLTVETTTREACQ